MCLITFKPANTTSLNLDKLRLAHRSNDDGFGIMVPDNSGRVQVIKSLGNWQEFENAIASVDMTAPMAIHFRMRTHGDISLDNCHPYPVLSKDTHGMDLYVMHNGILSAESAIADSTKGESDTAILVRDMLTPILSKCPGLIRTQSFQSMIASHIGTGNKLVFMEGTGRVHVINEKAGHDADGVWYSNTYSFAPSFTSFSGLSKSSKFCDWGDDFEDWKDEPAIKTAGVLNTTPEEELTDYTYYSLTPRDLIGLSPTEIFEIVTDNPEGITDLLDDMVNRGRF